MKKLFTLSILILLLSAVPCFADNINVVIDGKPVQFTSKTGYPFMTSNNRTMIPMRIVMEQYGYTVDWNNDTNTAIFRQEDEKIELPIGAPYFLANGLRVDLDTPAHITNCRTYLPVRPVLETLWADINWDNNTNTVIVTSLHKKWPLETEDYIEQQKKLIAEKRGGEVYNYPYYKKLFVNGEWVDSYYSESFYIGENNRLEGVASDTLILVFKDGTIKDYHPDEAVS